MIADLSNTKIWVGDDLELSKQVQLKAFELGWRWYINGTKINVDVHNALYFYSDQTIFRSSSGRDYFNNQTTHREILLADLGIGVEQITSISTDVELIMF